MQWGIQTDGNLFHYERHDDPASDAPSAVEAETDMSQVRALFLFFLLDERSLPLVALPCYHAQACMWPYIICTTHYLIIADLHES